MNPAEPAPNLKTPLPFQILRRCFCVILSAAKDLDGRSDGRRQLRKPLLRQRVPAGSFAEGRVHRARRVRAPRPSHRSPKGISVSLYTLPDPVFSNECLAAIAALCKRERVNLSRIELRYSNSHDEPHSLSLTPADVGETTSTDREVALSARLEHAIGGTMIHVTITNRGDEPTRIH